MLLRCLFPWTRRRAAAAEESDVLVDERPIFFTIASTPKARKDLTERFPIHDYDIDVMDAVDRLYENSCLREEAAAAIANASANDAPRVALRFHNYISASERNVADAVRSAPVVREWLVAQSCQ